MNVPKLKGKQVIIYGERDQVPSDIIKKAVIAAGATVLRDETACFSWGSAESVGTADQKFAKDAIDKYGAENIVVILGFINLFTFNSFEGEFGEEGSAGWTTMKIYLDGDPSGAGALSQDNPPGIKCYSPFEFKDQIPKDVWEEALEDFEILEGESIEKSIERMKEIRGD